MFPKKILCAAFSLFAFFSFAETQIFACSCGSKPTVLDEFESSELVVAAKLVSVEKILKVPAEKAQKDADGNETEADEENDDNETGKAEHYVNDVKSSTMRVEKVYKGNVKVGDILTFAQGGGADCIWTFDEDYIGSEYLFYLGNPSKVHPFFSEEDTIANKDAKPMYYAVTCGRSRGLAGANDDLLYLDNLANTRGRTRLSGTLESWSDEAPSFANVKIKIVGKKKTYETKTDADGVYEIYDLPAGEYSVEPQTPNGWKLEDYMLRRQMEGYSENPTVIGRKSKYQVSVIIREKKHAALDLLYEIDNAVRGKILSPAGKPMKNVCVAAVASDSDEGDYRGRTECTDEKGEFKLESLSAGNYILVVNNDGKIDGDEPFGTLFYPGVAERKSAGVVAVEAGKFVNNINIQIPHTVELIEVKGRLIYSDGKPVVEKYVKFKVSDESIYKEDSVKSDDSGRFSINIPKGAKGILFAEDYVYESKFDECANKAEILKRVGAESKDIKTNEIEIDADKNLADVKLIFPFPHCAKTREQ